MHTSKKVRTVDCYTHSFKNDKITAIEFYLLANVNKAAPNVNTWYACTCTVMNDSQLSVPRLIFSTWLFHFGTSSLRLFPSPLRLLSYSLILLAYFWFYACSVYHYLESLQAVINISWLSSMDVRGEREITVLSLVKYFEDGDAHESLVASSSLNSRENAAWLVSRPYSRSFHLDHQILKN